MKKHSTLLPDLFGAVGFADHHPPGPGPGAADQTLMTSRPHPDSFCAGVRLAVRVAQCFSLIPVRLAPGSEPRFRWRSFRVGYSFLVMLSFFGRIYMDAVQSVSMVAVLEDIMSHMFVIIIVSSFFMLGRRWRQFSLVFLRMEKYSENSVGDSHTPGVGRKMWLVTIVVFGCALAEHFFDRLTEVINAVEFNNYTSAQEFFDDTLLERPFWDATLTVFEQVTTSYLAFIVTFNDLFTMLVSVYLARRIANFNSYLTPSLTKNTNKCFWENARNSYDALARLTRDIDNFISRNILITFVRNLFYICFQLLYFLRNSDDHGLSRSVFHIYSFGYVLVRTFAVSYFAAVINDLSKLSKTFLFSVSEHSYCPEVHRFLEQAANDEMYLTGYNFFRVTRSFILTVAGTMATYEVILLQINKTS